MILLVIYSNRIEIFIKVTEKKVRVESVKCRSIQSAKDIRRSIRGHANRRQCWFMMWRRKGEWTPRKKQETRLYSEQLPNESFITAH